MAVYHFQNRAIEQTGRVPVMTSQPNRDLSIPSKFRGSGQPADRRFGYRILKFCASPRSKRLAPR